MNQPHRLVLKWARTLHVYLTLFGFVLLFFFAVTGFMLNHEDWFSPNEPIRHETKGKIPTTLLGEKPNRLDVVELLRRDFAVAGALDSFDDEDPEQPISVKFKSPGRFSEATIQREDGDTVVNHESRGFVGVVLDLHRGKDSGLPWSFVIDGVSVLFLIISITGLILWSSLRSRAQYGVVVLALGLAIGLVVYFVWVPR